MARALILTILVAAALLSRATHVGAERPDGAAAGSVPGRWDGRKRDVETYGVTTVAVVKHYLALHKGPA